MAKRNETSVLTRLSWPMTPKLRSIIEHAIASDLHRIPYGGDATEQGPALWMIKDEGIYLMSAAPGRPHLDEATGHPVVEYAQGYGPDATYDQMTDAVGGDDFIEAVPVTAIGEHLDGIERLEARVTDDEIEWYIAPC